MTLVRRVRADEWERVRDFRIQAVSDPAARIAFLSTIDEERARDDDFWRDRATNGAGGSGAAQFIAEDDGRWSGTVTVLVRASGGVDHTGRAVERARADVVGVYVDPAYRGSGVVDALMDAAASWVESFGFDRLDLDVHADNTRAQGAYRRCGFHATGESFTGPIGPELGMARELVRD